MPSRITRVVRIALALVALAAVSWAQATVQKRPMRPIASVSGKDMYRAYCAHCHGDDGKGHGPDWAGLRTPLADLTTIAARNGGKFVARAVEDQINGWNRIPRSMQELAASQRALETADAVSVMPAFGPIFAQLWPQEVQERRMRMTNLVSYVKSLQAKAPPPGSGR